MAGSSSTQITRHREGSVLVLMNAQMVAQEHHRLPQNKKKKKTHTQIPAMARKWKEDKREKEEEKKTKQEEERRGERKNK